MSDPALDVLVVSDLHYVCQADHVSPIARRKSALGVTLVREALRSLEEQGLALDLLVILGDVVDNGAADRAELDLAAVAQAAHAPGLPVLAIPGNHDGDFGRYACIFGCPPGLHEIGGYGFLLFHDAVGLEDVTTRPPEEVGLPERTARARPGLPLIALQHNPLHPWIRSDYPYMLTNAAEVLSIYQDAGVILSLSGHYHPGQAVHRIGRVSCCTIPALCEEPFHFAYLRLRGREVEVREHALGKQG